jgi:serine protease Do
MTAVVTHPPAGSLSLRTKLAAATLAGFSILAFTFGDAKASITPDSFADLAEEVSPAVVGVVVEQEFQGVTFEGETPHPFGPNSPYREFFERFFGDQFTGFPEPEGERGEREHRRTGLGSGFIIDPSGYIVTNNHVVGDAIEIMVTLDDGSELEAELIGRDRRTDLALLKVEADEPLPAVGFGDSDGIRVGDWVMAVGNPFGFGGTVTVGVVSARGRDLRGGTLVDFLQVDAPINRGNSGGPTFNLDGEVIGINTAIFSPNGGNVGIGFAIPANTAKRIIDDLKDDGQVSRGWLGVRIQPVTDEIAEGFGLEEAKGALVAKVEADSPAAEAGLKAGDVILEWNGTQVERFKDLSRAVAETRAGKEVEVVLWRGGREETVMVETGHFDEEQIAALEQKGKAGEARDMSDVGLKVAELDDETRAQLGLDEGTKGVLVTGVERGSAAAQAGIRRGDVIESVALRETTSAKALREAIEGAQEEGKNLVPLLINRRGEQTFVTLGIQTG